MADAEDGKGDTDALSKGLKNNDKRSVLGGVSGML